MLWFWTAANTAYMSGTAPASSARNAAVDLFRGLGLWSLFVDHLDPDFWSYFTLGHFGLSDFAEIFIFLSGYINAGMYRRALETGGLAHAARKTGSRMARLYAAHLATMVAGLGVLAAFASAGLRLNEPVLYVWMDAPLRYALRTLALLYAPRWFDLLPLYIVLSPVTLLAVIGLRRRPLFTLAVSGAIWLMAQSHVFYTPAMARGEAWSFNPLAWQFLFVIGASAQMHWERVRRIAATRTVRACAAAVVLISLALRAVTRFSAVRRRIIAISPLVVHLVQHDAGKASLAPTRLLHFLSLAILVIAIPWNRRKLFEWPVARAAVGVGRDSLFIFCVTLVLTAAANLLLQYYGGGKLLQLTLSVGGPAIMCGLAYARGKVPARLALQPEQSRK
jgi:hypothetical protein